MSHFLDRLTFFNRVVDDFSDGHGITTNEDRRWEDGYRKRWQHDKIVRSTHGVNCTGSCSWKVYVKGGIVTWETQQTDYPRTRPELPNHEPRGCARGASYSWYLYSANRVKYPLVRSRLLKLWREARAVRTPVAAWASIQSDPAMRASYTSMRGSGGFVRATWDEVTEIMRVNVEKVLERDAMITQLDERADALKEGAEMFEKQAGALKSKFWWKNMKMILIMAGIGVVLLMVLFVWFSK